MLALAVALVACGKRGDPLPPPDAEPPRTYPAPETVVPQRGEEPAS